MGNMKNPAPLMIQRLLQAAGEKTGLLVAALTNFFSANYGKTTLPKVAADFAIFDQLAVVGTTLAAYFQGQFTIARSNFPNGSFTMPESEHALILGIRIYTGAAATVTATDWQPGANDAAVKNGKMDILINGQKVLTELPLTQFGQVQLSATHQGETDQDRGTFYFYEPLVLLGQTNIAVNVSFPTAPATANLNLRVELVGVRFIGN
jgi:hypothetical protein